MKNYPCSWGPPKIISAPLPPILRGYLNFSDPCFLRGLTGNWKILSIFFGFPCHLGLFGSSHICFRSCMNFSPLSSHRFFFSPPPRPQHSAPPLPKPALSWKKFLRPVISVLELRLSSSLDFQTPEITLFLLALPPPSQHIECYSSPPPFFTRSPVPKAPSLPSLPRLKRGRGSH